MEIAYRILKKDLGTSRDDFKDVIRKFQFILNRVYDKVTTKYHQKSRKLVQRFNINLFGFIQREVINQVFNIVLKQFDRLKYSKIIKNPASLKPCTQHFDRAYGLFCAYEIKARLEKNERLQIDDFYEHWLYDKGFEPRPPDFLDLVQNPLVVSAKDRPKGSIEGAKRKKKADWSAERDSSQFELVDASISGDISKLKGIYRVLKKAGRSKAAPKVKTMPKSPLKK